MKLDLEGGLILFRTSLMTPASWVPEKGRLASEERDGCARELNRERCADMWVSPQAKTCSCVTHCTTQYNKILLCFDC